MIATFSTQDLDFKSRFGELLKRGAMDICNVEERVKNLLCEITIMAYHRIAFIMHT